MEKGRSDVKMPYSDIIHLSRPVSTKHPPMPIEKRAAQFNPFAALSGYEALATETARLTTAKASLSENEEEHLNTIMQQLLRLSPHPQVSVEYLVQDSQKDGGAYHMLSGTIKKVDTTFKKLIFSDKTELDLDSIRSISSPLLPKDTFYE